MKKYILYSIDNAWDLYTLGKFLSFMSQKEAMCQTTGKTKLCIGSYKGKLETSFLSRAEDFFDFVQDTLYFKDQESYLLLEPDGTSKGLYIAGLVDKDGITEHIGTLGSLSEGEAMGREGWTYRPDMKTYFGIRD